MWNKYVVLATGVLCVGSYFYGLHQGKKIELTHVTEVKLQCESEKRLQIAAFQKQYAEGLENANRQLVEGQRRVTSLESELKRVRAGTNKLRESSDPADRDRARSCDVETECGELLVRAYQALQFCEANHK